MNVAADSGEVSTEHPTVDSDLHGLPETNRMQALVACAIGKSVHEHRRTPCPQVEAPSSRLDPTPIGAGVVRPGLGITVVTPSFEQVRFLEACIRSVLDQGYPDLEYIVVDGGSQDGSAEVLRRYEDRLAFWISEPDRGQAHAINKGLARSTGEVLGWLNSDDLLLPGSLHRIGRAFRRRSETMAVAGLRRRIDGEGRFLGNWIRDLPTARHLRHYCCVAQETVYWRRQAWQAIGDLDEDLHYALDYDYWLRMHAEGFDITWIPSYLGAFREHPSSKTSQRQDVYQRDIQTIYRRYGLGRNEEDVLARMGEFWPQRLAFFEDLGGSRWSRSPRLVSLLLRGLEHERVHARLTTFYRRYRRLRPRGSSQPSRLAAMIKAGKSGLQGRPVGDRRDPFLLPSDPLNRPRVCAADAQEDVEILGPPDTLRVGEGWSWVEHSPDHVYRWAENDAEIVVLRPSGKRSAIVLDLEAGPALDWGSFELEVLDERDRVLCKKTISARETLCISLPLEPTSKARVFRLRVPDLGGPTSAADPRVLRFRATRIRWAREEPRYDLQVGPGQVAEIVLQREDIVPTDAVARLLDGGHRSALPRPGLFLGRGWWPFDPETGCRRPGCEAELVVCHVEGGVIAMRSATDILPRSCKLRASDGLELEGRISERESTIFFDLPAGMPVIEVFRLSWSREASVAPSIARLEWVTSP